MKNYRGIIHVTQPGLRASCQASHSDGILTKFRLHKLDIGSHSKDCWIFDRDNLQYIIDCWAIVDEFNDEWEDEDEDERFPRLTHFRGEFWKRFFPKDRECYWDEIQFFQDCYEINATYFRNIKKINNNDFESLSFTSDLLQTNCKLPYGSQTNERLFPPTQLTNPGKNDLKNVTKEHSPAPNSNVKCHKSSVKNTLLDFKISGRQSGLVHRKHHKKSLKKSLKRNTSDLKIMSSNIRGLGNKKSSLEDILESQAVDICCIQEVNNKNPP